MNRFSLFIFLMLLSGTSWAQLPVGDQLPANVKWYQLDTDHFKLIFPEDYKQEAQRTANYLASVQHTLSDGLNHEPRKIRIVLNNQNFISNGFVSLQPWKSEFYTTPTQDYRLMGNNDWVEMLATHEYRHVVQLDKVNTGFNRFLYFIFGNQVIAGIEEIALPDWYLEGDATLMETVHTHGGRGRLPAFDLEFRTNLLEGKEYSYHKQHLGSFKDFVPDEYRLGYFMTTYLREKHGEEVWEKIHLNAKRWPIIPFIFSNSIKKASGKYLVPTYEDMMASMKEKWTEQQKDLKFSDYQPLIEDKPKVFTSYEYAQPLGNGSWVALKSGMADFQHFVTVTEDGREEVLHVPGVLNSAPMLSARNGKLVWTEYRWNPRWSNETYSVIMILDVNSGTTRELQKKTKYHTADLSPDGSKMVTVETLTPGRHEMRIIDSRTGEVLQTVKNPDNNFFITPRFTEDGGSIVTVRMEGDKRGVSIYDLNTDQWDHLIEPDLVNYSNAVHHGHYVFFNSAQSGIDNIYAIHLQNRNIFQVTSDKSGAYNPSFSGDHMVYSRYQLTGQELVQTLEEPDQWTPLESVINRPVNAFQATLEQESSKPEIKNEEHEIKPYSRLNGLLNLYNWGPIFDVNTFEAQLGVLGTDVLNLNTLSAGYTWDFNENTGYWFGRYSYQGFFPVLDFEFTSGTRDGDRYGLDPSQDTVLILREVVLERSMKAGFRIPLTWVNSRFFQNFEFGSSFGLINAENFQEVIDPGAPVDGQMKFLEHRIFYSSLHKRSFRDLRSKLGQVYSFSVQHTPFESDFDESLYLAMEAQYFLPGFSRHHSFNFRLGYQHQRILNLDNSVSYIFRKTIRLPRGYGSTFFENMTSLSLNYELPLFYPDLELGPLMYFQRLKMNAFYDVAWADLEEAEFTLDSYGIELTTNFNVMRWRPLLDVGIRWAYLPDVNDNVFELVIGAIRL